jgi:hypothetical protein
MNGWQVYWLLQLDSINVAMTLICIGLLICSGICLITWTFNQGSWDNKELGQRAKKSILKFGIPGAIFYIITALIPSTKTMAAVYVVPKIIHGDTIEQMSKDSADIYKLGVNRLKELLEEKK